MLCSKCGAELNGSSVCPSCGEPAADEAQQIGSGAWAETLLDSIERQTEPEQPENPEDSPFEPEEPITDEELLAVDGILDPSPAPDVPETVPEEPAAGEDTPDVEDTPAGAEPVLADFPGDGTADGDADSSADSGENAPDASKKKKKEKKAKKKKEKKRENTPETVPVNGETDAPPEPAGEEEKEEPDYDVAADKEERGQKNTIIVLSVLVAVLLLGIVFLLLFGSKLNFALPHRSKSSATVRAIEIVQISGDSLTVRIDSDVDEQKLEVTRTSVYGGVRTVPVKDGLAEFSELHPGTRYSVTVSCTDGTKLSGSTVSYVRTPDETEVLLFCVTDGMEPGTALVAFTVTDSATAPKEWTVSYTGEDGNENSRTFTGTGIQIGGLNEGEEYLFTLSGPEGTTLTGMTQTVFTPVTAISADGLKLDSWLDGTAKVSWNGNGTDSVWKVLCIDDTGSVFQSQEVRACSAVIDGLELGREYTVKVTAEGLFRSMMLQIPADLIQVDAFSTESRSGGIFAEWTYSAGEDAGGWILSYWPEGCGALAESVLADGNSVKLTGLIPDTVYEIELRSTTGALTVGNNRSVCASYGAERFRSRGIRDYNTNLGIYEIPGVFNYTVSDITEVKNTCSPDEDILFMMTSGTGKYGGQAVVMWVARNEEGGCVASQTRYGEWDRMFSARNDGTYAYSDIIPAGTLPEGTCTLSLYISMDMSGSPIYELAGESDFFAVAR